MNGLSRVLGGIPWALPAAVAAIAIAGLLAVPVARRTGQTTAVAWLVLASLFVIVGITLTPSVQFPYGRGCDLTLATPTLRELVSLNDRSLNIALFVPLGIAVMAIRTRHRLTWLVLAAAVAPVIELTQLLATPLWRTCQAIDLIDNELGLATGVVAGSIGLWAWRRMRRAASREELTSGAGD